MKSLLTALLVAAVLTAAFPSDAAAQTRAGVLLSKDQTIRQSETVSAHEGGVSSRRMWATGIRKSRTTTAPLAKTAVSMGPGVLRRVPQQYSTIQAAINAAANGDTVLVSEGTYWENIRYRGKAITVASLYLMDHDTMHIDKTIIDGSKPSHPDSGSVVYFINGEDTTSVLCGLTIRGGTGTLVRDWSGVIGGGVFMENSGGRLTRNVIAFNRALGRFGGGGGVAVEGNMSASGYVILEGNRITDNFVKGDSVKVDTLWGWAYSGGADLWNTSARVVGNVFERDTVEAADFGAGGAMSFYSNDSLPSFKGDIRGNIFRSNVVNAYGIWAAGVFVSWTGEVMITENLFQGNMGNATSYTEGGGILIDDSSPDNTSEIPGLGRKMVFGNRFLNNQISGSSLAVGAGVNVSQTRATLGRNEIRDNVAVSRVGYSAGGGIGSYLGGFRLENNIIAGNSANNGGGMEISGVPRTPYEQVIVNNTFVSNSGTSNGGGIRASGANFVSLNNIFWANTAVNGPSISLSTSTAQVHYCDVQGGWGAGSGNFNADPQFLDAIFRISNTSPCLGAGIDSIQIGGRWYKAPSTSYNGWSRPWRTGTKPDVGACENPSPDGLGEPAAAGVAACWKLEQNYPNPFNPTTVVSYQLPAVSDVRLVVYDLLGQEVAVLVDERKAPGSYTVTWDASGMASGVYFCRMTAGEFRATKQLALVR